MESEKNYRQQVLAIIPPQKENQVWRPIDPAEQHRFECERFSSCGEDAKWVTQQGNLRVCDYHRFLFEVLRIVKTITDQDSTLSMPLTKFSFQSNLEGIGHGQEETQAETSTQARSRYRTGLVWQV